MTISIAIPPLDSLSQIGLSRVSSSLLTDPNPQSSSLPLIEAHDGIAAQLSYTVPSDTFAGGLDPLTPKSSTPGGTAALASITSNIVATLNSVQNSNGQSVSQAVGLLLQSQGFLLLFQALAASETTATASVSTGQLASLVPTSGLEKNGTVAASNSHGNSPEHANANSSTSAATSSSANAPGSKSPDAASSPYFHKLLGELDSTLNTPAPAAATGATPQTFELDVFLQWLSHNGSSSIAANA